MATHCSILAWRIPIDSRAWWATVHRVAKSQTRLSTVQASNLVCSACVSPVSQDFIEETSFPHWVFLDPSSNVRWPVGLPGDSDGKESACNAGDQSSISGSGRSLGKGMATYSNNTAWRVPWTRAWQATAHGVTELDTTKLPTLSLFSQWDLILVSLFQWSVCLFLVPVTYCFYYCGFVLIV